MNVFEFIATLVEHLAWPVAIIVLAFAFRSRLGELLPRITKMGPAGVELTAAKQSTEASEELQAVEVSRAELEPLSDPTAIAIEERNKQALDELSQEPAQREKILLRALTAQQLEKNFFQVYRGIFGSQIRALKLLNERPVPINEAEEMFNKLKAADPALSDWSLELYLNYLRSWQLISEDRDRLVISPTGRSFLHFLVQHGLSEERLH